MGRSESHFDTGSYETRADETGDDETGVVKTVDDETGKMRLRLYNIVIIRLH